MDQIITQVNRDDEEENAQLNAYDKGKNRSSKCPESAFKITNF